MAIKMNKYPDQDLLKKIFDYKDGHLIWKFFNNKYSRVGEIVGTNSHNLKYWRVRILIKGVDRIYYVHRLIWIWHNGEIPEGLEVDHIDLSHSNNRIENLRLVSHNDNLRNMRQGKRNKSGFSGISWYSKTNKWRASIGGGKIGSHIGYFVNIEDAIKARKEAMIKHGFSENHGSVLNEATP